ncbi:unnamed protein product, partial [Mesorhabditis belari]|uniref:Globin domain-containing protein n=1 Tax=Mesorhabditis belari TaxID=2138241 RepID=A0AAF3FD65_9BILA
MLDGVDSLMRYLSTSRARSVIPHIEVTPSRKLSIPNQLRFTRTCSHDTLDKLEKTCRKELKLQKMALESTTPQQASVSCLLPSPSMCPLMSDLGRSRTEPSSLDAHDEAILQTKRSMSNLSIETPTKKSLAEVIGLTTYQQKLLIQAWPTIYSTGVGGSFASSIFMYLGMKNSKAKQIFAKANSVAVFANSEMDCTSMHSRATLDLLDTIVKCLDQDHTKITAYLFELGKRHRSLRQDGLCSTVWDDMGDSLLESVRRFDCVRKHKELRRAWLSVFAYVTDNLKQGASIRSSSSYDLHQNSLDSEKSSLPLHKKSVI